MLKAIHKETDLLVSSFKLTKDIEWIGKEKDLFKAPNPEIGNWKELEEQGIKEVEVLFVKQHERRVGKGITDVIPHFRIKTKGAIINPLNESEEHLLCKEGLYENILTKTLKINGENISNFNIVDVDIEHKLSPTKKSKIADVSCDFKQRHPIYGKGIVFEVQFSNQNEEKTEERTYDRVLQEYSVCWLWKGDFTQDNELKKKELEVIPFSKALNEYLKKTKEVFQREIFIGANKFDSFSERLENIQREFLEEIDEKEKEICSVISNKMSNIHQKLEEYSKRVVENNLLGLENEINEKTKEMSQKRIEEITRRIQEEINVKNITEEIIEIVLKKGFNPKTTKESMIKTSYPENMIRQCKFCASWNCIAYPDLIQCFDCKKRWKDE